VTAPTPAFTGPISAAEDLALSVGDRLPTDSTDWPTVDKTLAALLAGGTIRVEWGYRLTYNDGQTKTRWVGDAADAEAVARTVALSPRNWAEPGRDGEVLRQFVIVTAPEVTQ
jgi:hypothetical protein